MKRQLVTVWSLGVVTAAMPPVATAMSPTFGMHRVAYLDELADVVASDVDEDGDIDLVSGGEHLYLHRNRGDASFEHIVVLADVEANAITLGSIGGTEGPDVAYASWRDFAVHVELDFSSDVRGGSSVILLEGPPSDVEIVDLDGDGSGELIVTDLWNDRLLVYRLNAADEWVLSTDASTPPGPTCIATGDFNGDSWVDVAVLGALDAITAVWLNDQAGGLLRESMELTLPGDSRRCVAQDMDGDGVDEILAADWFLNAVHICERNDDGFWTLAASLPASIATFGVCAADFNNDGFVDIAASAPLMNEVNWWLNDGFGGFCDTKTTTGRVGATELIAADLTGDARAELIWTALEEQVIVASQDSAGWFGSRLIELPHGTAYSADAAYAGPDGRPLVVFGATEGRSVVGEISLGSLAIEATIPGSTFPVFAHLNGDDLPDLVLYHGGSLSYILHDSLGGFGQPTPIASPPIDLYVPADIDGDGIDDLVIVSEDQIMVFQNQDLAFVPLPVPPLTDVVFVAVSDMDEDGLPDLVALRDAGSLEEVVVLPQQPGGGFSVGSRTEIQGFVDLMVVAADLDGDGDQDVITSGSNLYVIENVGGGVLGAAVVFPGSLDYLEAVDIDLDGLPDIVTLTSEGNLRVFRNTGGLGFLRDAVLFALPEPIRRTGYTLIDVDGDRLPDLVATDRTSGPIEVFNNRTLLCPGDTNRDAAVDFTDLNRVLDEWGHTVPARSGADVSGDGTVNFADLNDVLDNWAAPCPQ